jgi:hypothetical protein
MTGKNRYPVRLKFWQKFNLHYKYENYKKTFLQINVICYHLLDNFKIFSMY